MMPFYFWDVFAGSMNGSCYPLYFLLLILVITLNFLSCSQAFASSYPWSEWDSTLYFPSLLKPLKRIVLSDLSWTSSFPLLLLKAAKFSMGAVLPGEWKDTWEGELEVNEGWHWRGDRGQVGLLSICWLAVLYWFSLLEGELMSAFDLSLSLGLLGEEIFSVKLILEHPLVSTLTLS